MVQFGVQSWVLQGRLARRLRVQTKTIVWLSKAHHWTHQPARVKCHSFATSIVNLKIWTKGVAQRLMTFTSRIMCRVSGLMNAPRTNSQVLTSLSVWLAVLTNQSIPIRAKTAQWRLFVFVNPCFVCSMAMKIWMSPQMLSNSVGPGIVLTPLLTQLIQQIPHKAFR